jgi:hypothetical protein
LVAVAFTENARIATVSSPGSASGVPKSAFAPQPPASTVVAPSVVVPSVVLAPSMLLDPSLASPESGVDGSGASPTHAKRPPHITAGPHIARRREMECFTIYETNARCEAPDRVGI